MSKQSEQAIYITVESRHLPQESDPSAQRYVFAYTITIENNSNEASQLLNRHWIITDARGKIEEVRGDGVIGEKPILRPGQEFHYTSGCVLATPRGTMHGSYQMHCEDGFKFDATISPFVLAKPGAEVERVLN